MFAANDTLRVPSGLQSPTDTSIEPVGQLLSHCRFPACVPTHVGSVAQVALTTMSPPHLQRRGISADQFPSESGVAITFGPVLFPQVASTMSSTNPPTAGGLHSPVCVPV